MNSIPPVSRASHAHPARGKPTPRAAIPTASPSPAKSRSIQSPLPSLAYQGNSRTAPAAPPEKKTAPIPSLSPMARRVSRAMENTPPQQKLTSIPPQGERPRSEHHSLPLFNDTPESPPGKKKEADKDDDDEHRPRAVSNTPFQSDNSARADNSAPDFDENLQNLVENSVRRAFSLPENGLYLEPMMRQSVRRALAEQAETSPYFSRLSAGHRFSWRLKALFTSRSYDDIVFERTRRYQVMEVFLVHRRNNILVSYASNDPSRHSEAHRVRSDFRKLLKDCRDRTGELLPAFPLPGKNHAILRKKRLVYLIAITRGESNALVESDLDHLLAQVEQQFRNELENNPGALLRPLQSILESCLLIQSPPPPQK